LKYFTVLHLLQAFFSNYFSLLFVTGRAKNFDKEEINHKGHKEKKHKEPQRTAISVYSPCENFVPSVVKKITKRKNVK
jgi:hypothetical protein